MTKEEIAHKHSSEGICINNAKQHAIEFDKWVRLNYTWDKWLVTKTEDAYELFIQEQSKPNPIRYEIIRNPIDYLDNTKKEFTEANMFEFALDYFERFCSDYAENKIVDSIAADKFLSENIKKFNNK